MNTNTTKIWTIKISEDEVFARCTNETLYQAYNRSTDNPKGDAVVIQDDDRGMFSLYFSHAVANLRMLLARRLAEYPVANSHSCSDVITFDLMMHDNHDDNILPILKSHCYEYIVRQILEQWYHVDFGSEIERLEINHCLHYRKNPVRRRLGPLF